MRAELKSLECSDLDLETYYPEDPKKFGFCVQAMIGIEGSEGADSFAIEICTPKWLMENDSETDVVFGRHKLIVFDYDINKIRSTIARYCEYTFGDEWLEMAEKLARIGYWEFEDYRP